MMPIYPTMWQMYPASGIRDLLDYLEIWLFEDLTDEEFARGVDHLDPPMEKLCSMDDCTKPHLARGMCGMHYQRWERRVKAKQA